MKTTLAISLLSIFCLSCSATDVAATSASPESSQHNTAEIDQDTRHRNIASQSTVQSPIQSPIAQVPLDDPASIATEAPHYSGEVGTIAGDRTLADFLFAHDGEVVSLNISVDTSTRQYGENWLSLCTAAAVRPKLTCTDISINYVPATEYDIFLQTEGNSTRLNGFYIVRANPGMHQGILSISLLGMP